MIIFGTRGLTLNKGKPGQFFCPGCNGHRPYQRRKVQRFFTLYFIPLIPLDILQEFIRCQTCQQNYRPNVLEYDPTIQRQAQKVQLNENVRALLVHFARMSSRRDAVFLGEIAKLYHGLTSDALATDAISSELARPQFNITPATERLAPMLNDRGREALIVSLIKVAAPIDTTKEAALKAVARILGMTDAHYLGVLALPRVDLLPTGSNPPVAYSVGMELQVVNNRSEARPSRREPWRRSGSNSPLGPSRTADAMQTEETRTEYAGFWRRLGGFLIDLALLIAIFACAFFGIAIMAGVAAVLTGQHIPEPGTRTIGLLLLLLQFGIPIGYYSFFESGRTQATPGKRMLDIYVTDLNGGRITLARALGRYFGKYLSSMLNGVGFVMCVWTDRSQCLHDKLANTLVMRGRV
jgi:uncharacterized RDD family membrane protein YckC